MRWSEQQLEEHLKAHGNRKIEAVAQFKKKNDAKVRQVKQKTNTAQSERNSNSELKEILNCEIATTPPSVNHYWEKSKYGFKLSDRAKEFHSIVQMLVPSMGTDSRLKLDVTFHFPDKTRRDIDNFLKATIDSLVKCRFCVDDEQFDTLIVNRGHVVPGGLIKIRVFEMGK